MMRRFAISSILATGIAAIGLAGAAPAAARDMTVTAWGGASQEVLRNVIFKPFAQEAGVKLVEDSWSGGIGVLRTKVKGGNATWDVVSVEVEVLILGCEEGLFEKMDWNRLGGRDKFLPAAVHDCGVGGETWSIGLAYDGDRIKDGPKNWADFWDVKKWPGKRGMRTGPKYTLEIALMADGVPAEDVYKLLATPAGVDRAFRKLDELRPHIVWWSSASQVPDLLASGEVALSVGTAGRVFAANDKDKKNFKLVWDQSIYAVDFWVVLKGTPHKENAMRLVAYASRPEVQAKIPPLIALGATNKQAIAMLDPKTVPNNPANPDNLKNAMAINDAHWVEHSDQLTQRFNAWAARK